MQDIGEEERNGLSPGLFYLEQVCQMLEEIARKQMHSRALKMEIDAQWEHQDIEVSQVKTFMYLHLCKAIKRLSVSTMHWVYKHDMILSKLLSMTRYLLVA